MAKLKLNDYQELETIDRLYSFNSLLDILLNIEGFLDDLNVYAYDENWYRGEIVSGPTISRYWIKVVLKFDEKYMPNPEVIKVLEKTGSKVHYEKGLVEYHEATNQFNNVRGTQYMDLEKKTKRKKVWYIEIAIPKKLIYNNVSSDFDKYQEDVDFDVFDSENSDEETTE